MLSGIWAKVVAGGAILLGILAAALKLFSAGKEAGQDEVIAKSEKASGEVKDRVRDVTREGEKKQREVKREDAPADYDRYR